MSSARVAPAPVSFSAKLSQPKFGCSVRGLAGARPLRMKAASKAVVMSSVAAEDVPTPAKRGIMNLLLVGALGLPGGYLAGGYAFFFVPPSAGGGGGASPALDAAGNAVKLKSWLETHGANSRALTQGLKGDATYLVVNAEANGIENYGVNAVCTHLGCVVPWNAAENKYMCPCHGSQYNFQGKVVRGPAPLSLALAHADVDESGTVVLSTWSETDFRTGLQPWWK